MAEELFGLDPERVRDLAAAARAAGDGAMAIAGSVQAMLAEGAIPDNGFGALCREIDEELGVLAVALDHAATAMELADNDPGAELGAALTALWASLSDDVGAGFHVEASPGDTGARVPMSSALAARTLADHVDDTGEALTLDGLRRLADDDGRPMALRAAALTFVLDPELWLEMPAQPGVAPTGDELRWYAEQTTALAVMATNIDAWTNASGDEDGGDARDDISLRDLQAVVDDDTGRFSEEERAAAGALRSDASLWDDLPALTLGLVRRRAFGERPGSAETYTTWAAERAEQAVDPLQWTDDEQVAEWTRQSLSTATDADELATVALSLGHLRLAVPPPEGLERPRQVLELIGLVEPTPFADLAVAATHLVEGDVGAAVTEGVGGLLPGAFDRLFDTRAAEHVVRRAVDRVETAHDLADAATSEMREAIDPVRVEEAVDIVTGEFGAYVGQVVRGELAALDPHAPAPPLAASRQISSGW